MELTSGLLTKVLGPQPPAVRKQAEAVSSAQDAQVFSAAAFSEGIAAPMTDKQLRSWYETNPWIFACVEERCQDISTADWEVRPKDLSVAYDKGCLTAIRELFERPNPTGKNDSMSSLMHPVALDSCCLDKGPVQILRTRGGEPYQLKALDGARVRVKGGWEDDSDGPRYLYMNTDRTDGVPLLNNELMLIQAHPSSYRPDGLAPLKVLNRILISEYDTFKSIHVLQKNRAPSAILKMPGSSPDAVDAAKSLWLNELAGRSGLGFMSIPAESDLMVLGSTNLEEQGAFAFYDMLIRAITAVFRTATLNLNWLQDVNRATAQEQSNLADDGTIAHLKLVQGYWNREVVASFNNSENIGFFYTQLPRDEALSIDVVRNMAGRVVNPWSINRMLEVSGFEKIKVDDEAEQEFYDKPLIGVANGQMAPPSVAMALPQFQGGAAPADGQPVDTSRPAQHPVDQVINAIPARASLVTHKGTPQRDLQQTAATLFDDLDAFFQEAQASARASLNGSK